MTRVTIDRIKLIGEHFLIWTLLLIGIFVFFELAALIIYLLLKSCVFWKAVIK